MAIATRKGITRPYILKQDRNEPPSKQTPFQIRVGLSARARARIHDAMVAVHMEGRHAEGRMGSMHHAAVQLGCAGWSNLRDESGQEVMPEFTSVDGTPALTDESMDRIAPYVMELALEVISANKLSETDAGNFESSPASPPDDSSQLPTGE